MLISRCLGARQLALRTLDKLRASPRTNRSSTSFVKVAPALAWNCETKRYHWLQTTIRSSGVEVQELGTAVRDLENEIFTDIYGGNHA